MSIDYIMDYLPNIINEHPLLKSKYGDIFVYKNTEHKMTKSGASDKCTGFIAVGNYTKDGKIVCGHNSFDNYITGQYQNILLEIKPDKGNSFIMQTSPGYIWSGTDYYVSSNGFICCVV